MTGLALVFLVLSIAIVWGGLVVSAVYLVRHPLPEEVTAHHRDTDFPREL